jgi:hypothetical protein
MDVRLGPDGWDGVLSNSHREVALSRVRSVYYRHPSHFVLPDGLSGPERRHAAAEARCGVGGVLASLEVPWVNPPTGESDALKPRQLAVARRCGLAVPAAQVTNSPAAVRDFAGTVGGPLASKTLAAAALVESGRLCLSYTRKLELAELADLDGVRTTAHLFEEYLDKAWEARVTVVGERVFAVGIHAGSEAARIDWRADYGSLEYEIVEPPAGVVAGMSRFLRAFGLSFGAFDFVVRPDGVWVMLECNPFGQYGWLEDALDLPITRALADLLAAEVGA